VGRARRLGAAGRLELQELTNVSGELSKQLAPCRLVGGLRLTLTVGPVAFRFLGLLACGHDNHDQDQGRHHGDDLRPVGPAKLTADGADQADGEESGQGGSAAATGLLAWLIGHQAPLGGKMPESGAATPGGGDSAAG
jgi:hypothetical protein